MQGRGKKGKKEGGNRGISFTSGGKNVFVGLPSPGNYSCFK